VQTVQVVHHCCSLSAALLVSPRVRRRRERRSACLPAALERRIRSTRATRSFTAPPPVDTVLGTPVQSTVRRGLRVWLSPRPKLRFHGPHPVAGGRPQLGV